MHNDGGGTVSDIDNKAGRSGMGNISRCLLFIEIMQYMQYVLLGS